MLRRSLIRTRWSALLLWAACAAPAGLAQVQVPGQPTVSAPAVPEERARPTLEEIEAERLENAAAIKIAEAAISEESALRLGVPIESLADRLARLRSVDAVLQQQRSALERLEELMASRVDLEREIEIFREQGLDLDQGPPYALRVADQYADAVSAGEQALESLEVARESAVSDREAAEARLQDAETAWRQARDQAEANPDASQTLRLGWQQTRAELEVRFLEKTLELRRLRKEIAHAELALGHQRTDFLQEKSRIVAAQTVFTRQELAARFDEIASTRDEVERSLPGLRDAHQTGEARRRAARERLQGAANDTDIASLTVLLASRTATVDTDARAVELAEQRLTRLDSERELWERRHAVYQGLADDSQLVAWTADVRELLQELDRDRQVQQSRLLDLRSMILEATRALDDADVLAGDRPALEARLEALRQRDDIVTAYLDTVVTLERLVARFASELDDELRSVTWGDRWERLSRYLLAIWNFELFVFEDDAITVRMLLIACIILAVGVGVVGLLTRTLRTRLLARTPLTEDAAAAVELLVYYVLLIGLVLYTLRFVRIPLTFFAFLGGAIALAVGFGAQHIINNFISGFILMLERPIRIGDLVQIEGTYGHIRRIGARSTRLHTPDNIDLLVPNSRLLENTVINWTLSNDMLRTSVTVGVAYGSPAEQVSSLLLQAATETSAVLASPAPVVLFTDFGDNALTFEVHFWVRMRRLMDKRQAESAVRFNVDRLFREHAIVIAFPQRDVHLDSVGPIDVRMVSASADGPAPSPTPHSPEETT